jgi:plasmid stabilization system protein ParE
LPSRGDLLADLPVDFSPLAREEFLHEVRYYAVRGQALRFIAAIGEALARVHAAPHTFPIVSDNPLLRRVLTKRFPFALVYVFDARSNEAPLVIAVAHGARRPGYWRGGTRRRARRLSR